MNHLRPIVAGAALLALLAAFGAGRYSRPAKVVTKDVVRVETQTRYVDKIQTVHDVQQVHDVQVQTHVVTQWKTAPGGTTVVTQYVDRDRQAESKSQDHAQGVQERTGEAHVTAVETHTTSTVYARPNWSLTAMAGVQFGAAPRLVPQLPAPAVMGLGIERRIAGPVSAGLWMTSGGAGGVSVRLDW